MTAPVASNNYSLGYGTHTTLIPIVSSASPTASNVIGPNGPFQIGQLWVNSASNLAFILTALSSAGGSVSATWLSI